MNPAPLNGVHAKTWILLGASGLLLAFSPLPLLGRLALLLVLVALFITRGAFGRFLRFGVLGLLPVALMAWLIQAISYRGETVYASWQPVRWMLFNITAEGMLFGTQLALQILCFGASCALVSLLTTPLSLRSALTSWKLPPRLIYLLCASLNAPRQLGFYADLARDAGRARGIADTTVTQRVWLRLHTASALFNLVLLDHEIRGHSLAMRGIDRGGARTFLTDYPDSRAQAVLRWSVVAGALALAALSYGGLL